MSGPEHTHVEQPFIKQLESMGWKHTTGNSDNPTATGRESFREVLLLDELRKALQRINPGPKDWLDEARLSQAISALDRIETPRLMEANQLAFDLLLKGAVVEGVEGWENGRPQTIHFIDWDKPKNNIFRVIDQFRVDEPGGQSRKYICPDLVLFVNGIPLVVVECKSPGPISQLEEAIDQLQRYANQREWVEGNEGNEKLFYTNQMVIATCSDHARVGTFSSQSVHFLEWKDSFPLPKKDLAKAFHKKENELSSQEVLVAGMLHPKSLLDLVRHFTLFTSTGGKTIKLICRYQQFRAVQLAIGRLLTGKTLAQDGEQDRRSGIIWHTQGSGKSLTMVFLIRKMRSLPALRHFKVVIVTDRKDLEKQLSETAALTGEPLTRVKPERRGQKTIAAIEVLKETLSRKGKDLVFAMIQKYQTEQGSREDLEEEMPTVVEPFPELNTDESILVIVDEAHRSHGNDLHLNLLRALPNCARIGFTGTPIIMGAKKRTEAIFGDFIDRYTIRQSEEDGSTLPIFYEGRTADGAVRGGGTVDTLFEDMFAERPAKERKAIQERYATKNEILEAPELIAEKALDMLRHYVANVLPNGFKAQVVAVSRRAAIRYQKAFLAARASMVSELEVLDSSLVSLPEEQVELLEPKKAFLVRAHRLLPLLKMLEFAPIISGGTNDEPDFAEWTDEGKIEARIARFKRPMPEGPSFDPVKADPLAFLIVKSMLLTGFDAPIEQVLYLDRHMKEAELLQAIARVNRTYGPKKHAGLVVDYYGVARHLKKALEAYEEKEIEGALRNLKDELPKLRDAHLRVMEIFRSQGIGIVGPLSEWERRRLSRDFASWLHPNVSDESRKACLGAGSEVDAEKVLAVLERFLTAPTPKHEKEPYPRLYEKVIGATHELFSAEVLTELQRRDATDKLILQVEPFSYKLLALLDEKTYQKLSGKKKGLAACITKMIDSGHSRYKLKLSDEEFQKEEGWQARSSYENATRDVVGARLEVAHTGAAGDKAHLWQSAMAFLLGLLDENLNKLEELPRPLQSELGTYEECVQLLKDEKLRAKFVVEMKQFLQTLDFVLPRPAALPYLSDAKALSFIQAKARSRYRSDDLLIGKDIGEKVRALIDEHVISMGIDQKIPLISLTDANFSVHIDQQGSARASASEMEHALRHHIRQHEAEDPEYYKKLSERLEGILKEMEGRWEELLEELRGLGEEARVGRYSDESGLDPETHAPFFALLKKASKGDVVIDREAHSWLRGITETFVAHIQQEIRRVGFWQSTSEQENLRKWFFKRLDSHEVVPLKQCNELAGRLVELAKANHHKLIR